MFDRATVPGLLLGKPLVSDVSGMPRRRPPGPLMEPVRVKVLEALVAPMVLVGAVARPLRMMALLRVRGATPSSCRTTAVADWTLLRVTTPLPRALLLPTATVRNWLETVALIVTPPENVLAPLKSTMPLVAPPLPVLMVRPPLPLMLPVKARPGWIRPLLVGTPGWLTLMMLLAPWTVTLPLKVSVVPRTPPMMIGVGPRMALPALKKLMG